jgi:hypothetical protein
MTDRLPAEAYWTSSQDRKGNWVQKFEEPDDVKLFATAQFSRYREVESFLNEHFADKKEVAAKATGRKPV